MTAMLQRNKKALLVLPILLFLAILFYIPAANLLGLSLFANADNGNVGGDMGVRQYVRLFSEPLYAKVLWTTFRISVITAVIATFIAVPVSIILVRCRPAVAQVINLIVIAPLLVSVVVRAYGWQLILANSSTGALNWLLLQAGLIDKPLRLMYSEVAVVIGNLHVFFPMMLLPLTAAMAKIDPALEDAARLLGATSFQVIRRVIIPMSMPGLMLGFAIVFALSAGSFVIPSILGGSGAMMLGNLIEQQIFVVYDRPFGAAIAVLLVVVVFSVNGLASRLAMRRASAIAGEEQR